MAEFGVQATELSAPQGAGTSPISPVEERAVNTFPGAVAEGLVDIFAKGLKQNAKEEADKRKNAVVASYMKEISDVNNALSLQQMKPEVAAARTRAISSKYFAGYSEYIPDLEQAAKAARGFTEIGAAEDEEKAAKQFQAKRKGFAQERGYTFYQGMSPDAEEAQIQAAEISKRNEDAMQSMYNAASFQRAQSSEQRSAYEFEIKHQSVRVIQEIGGSQLTAFQKFVKDLGDKVRGNQMSPDMAKVLLTERYSNISSVMAGAAGANPELVGAWRHTFDSIKGIGDKLIDPKQSAEDAENLYSTAINKGKLLAIQDPKVYGTVVADKLYTNPTVSLNIAPNVSSIVQRVSQAKPGSVSPQIVANPEVETEALELIKTGLKDISTGKNKDEVAVIQGATTVNEMLKQTGNLLNRGDIKPEQLVPMAKFFSSPEYASWVAKGKVDKDAAHTAYKVFQMMYEPTMIDTVQRRLAETVQVGDANESKPMPLKDGVEIRFTGSGVVFDKKPIKGMTMLANVQFGQSVKTLENNAKAINQLIHIAAHMEGHTNYSQVWESRKHIYFPNMFPAPADDGSKSKPKQQPTKLATTKQWWEE